MEPTAVIDGDHVLFFLDRHEAMKYWVFLPNREHVHLVQCIADIESGGWSIPNFMNQQQHVDDEEISCTHPQ